MNYLYFIIVPLAIALYAAVATLCEHFYKEIREWDDPYSPVALAVFWPVTFPITFGRWAISRLLTKKPLITPRHKPAPTPGNWKGETT